MDAQFSYDVFLSHSTKDKAVVRISSLSASNGERVGVRCRNLHSLPVAVRKHLKVWFDEWVLKAGDSIPITSSSRRESAQTSRQLAGRMSRLTSAATRDENIEEGLEHSRALVLCMSANAFGSDWAQLESGTFRFRDPLNKERRFIPLRLNQSKNAYD